MLKVLRTESDGLTGHITVHACVVEQNGKETTEGAVETFGIAADAFMQQYNGSAQEWLASVHRVMLQRHENRKTAANAMKSLQGVTLFNDEENEANGNHAQPAKA
jgi:hypothetical protein